MPHLPHGVQTRRKACGGSTATFAECPKRRKVPQPAVGLAVRSGSHAGKDIRRKGNFMERAAKILIIYFFVYFCALLIFDNRFETLKY